MRADTTNISIGCCCAVYIDHAIEGCTKSALSTTVYIFRKGLVQLKCVRSSVDFSIAINNNNQISVINICEVVNVYGN